MANGNVSACSQHLVTTGAAEMRFAQFECLAKFEFPIQLMCFSRLLYFSAFASLVLFRNATALVVREKVNTILWDTSYEMVYRMLECVDFDSLRAMELVGILFSLPHFLNHPLWSTPWGEPLIAAIVSHPTLHILLNSQMLTDSYMALVPTTGFHGILWMEGSGFFGFSEKEWLDNMRIHRHTNLIEDVSKPWLLTEDAWRIIPVELDCPDYEEYLQQRYIQSNGLEQQLLYLRQWQRKLQSLSMSVIDVIGVVDDVAGVVDNLAVFSLNDYLKGTTTAIAVIQQVIEMLVEVEPKEASAWLLDTFLTVLPNLTKSEQRTILSVVLEHMDPTNFAPMNFLALLNSPHFQCPPKQQHSTQWNDIFHALMRYYPGEILPCEPYETRYIRWQALYVLSSSVKDLASPLSLDQVVATMTEGLFKHALTLSNPVTLVYRRRKHEVKTLLEMCTWYLHVVRKHFCLYSASLKELLLVNPLHTKAVFNAIRYRFALTGQWNSLVSPHIMQLWWLDADFEFDQPEKLIAAYKPLNDAGNMIRSWGRVDYQIFRQYFHPTDAIFRIRTR